MPRRQPVCWRQWLGVDFTVIDGNSGEVLYLASDQPCRDWTGRAELCQEVARRGKHGVHRGRISAAAAGRLAAAANVAGRRGPVRYPRARRGAGNRPRGQLLAVRRRRSPPLGPSPDANQRRHASAPGDPGAGTDAKRSSESKRWRARSTSSRCTSLRLTKRSACSTA